MLFVRVAAVIVEGEVGEEEGRGDERCFWRRNACVAGAFMLVSW